MQVAFIDDSEQRKPRRRRIERLVAMGGAIFPEDGLEPFSRQVETIREELELPPTEEIKWKPPKGSFLARAGGDRNEVLRRRLLDAAARCGVRTIVVVLDRTVAYRDKPDSEVGYTILSWLYERLIMHLREVGEPGIVIADRPGGGPADERRWLADTLELTRSGTEYVQPGRVVLPVITADSRHIPHVQLADLVTAATTAAIAGHPSGLQLGSALAQLMRRHANGDVSGAGLVIFPPEDYNLLSHCFGEDFCTHPKYGRVSLPHPEWPYASSDGLPPRARAAR